MGHPHSFGRVGTAGVFAGGTLTRDSILSELRQVAEEACRQEGAELWDLRFVRGRGRSIVRITVEHPDGVTFDLLENVSRRVSRELDEKDPIAGPYQIECESPGLDRILRGLPDCRRFVGSAVRLRLSDGGPGAQRNFRGRLADVSDDAFLLEFEDGTVRWFQWVEVAELHLDPEG